MNGPCAGVGDGVISPPGEDGLGGGVGRGVGVGEELWDGAVEGDPFGEAAGLAPHAVAARTSTTPANVIALMIDPTPEHPDRWHSAGGVTD